MSESEINAALNAPEKIAEDGKEVQVAEMVKNILIPIPEDIMNDKNLTPQLVSPKKNKKQENEETAAESDTAENDGKSGGLLKSLASMFGSSDENAETAADDNENLQTEEKPKKRRGLFSAFSRDKSPAKILPAEMRLFLPAGQSRNFGPPRSLDTGFLPTKSSRTRASFSKSELTGPALLNCSKKD